MLTRLRVRGFKNLVDCDVRFGPFTCVAGPNGVGKSNLFDAINFLSALANNSLINAALSLRSERGMHADVRSLFHHVGDRYAKEMSFEAEMIVPREGRDDLGQEARASITFLDYNLVLGYQVNEDLPLMGSLKVVREELGYIRLGEAWRHLGFPHRANTWRRSAIHGRRRSPFISTVDQEGDRIIRLRQDGIGGKTRSILAADLPRTVISTVNAIENPTALLARREMQSWQLLQMEPSSLREPDRFMDPAGLGTDGSHLSATLYHLARSYKRDVYAQVAVRLSEMIDDVSEVSVNRDEQRELLTLEITDRMGTIHPLQSLSDGTLRLLALAVLELEPRNGLICLEEPEDSIHPTQIPAVLKLLQDISTDVKKKIGRDNPLRQIIINTHSPGVVNQVPDDSLLVAEPKEMVQDKQRFKSVSFRWLPDTWRQKAIPDIAPISKDELMNYLNPMGTPDQYPARKSPKIRHKRPQLLGDGSELQPMLPSFKDV